MVESDRIESVAGTTSPETGPVSSGDPSSNETSRPGSISEGRPGRGRGRVKFSVGGDDEEAGPGQEPLQLRKPLPNIRYPSGHATDRVIDADSIEKEPSQDVTEERSFRFPDWPAMDRRTTVDKDLSAFTAQQKASRLADRLGSLSAPNSRRTSLDNSSTSDSPSALPLVSGNQNGSKTYPVKVDDIPLVELKKSSRNAGSSRRPYSLYDDSTDDDYDDDTVQAGPGSPREKTKNEAHANSLIRAMTQKFNLNRESGNNDDPTGPSDQTPIKYKKGIHFSLYQMREAAGQTPQPQDRKTHRSHGFFGSSSAPSSVRSSAPGSPESSTTASGATTPNKRPKWYKSPNHSTNSMSGLLAPDPLPKPTRPGLPRSRSSGMLAAAVERIKHPSRPADGQHRLEHRIEIQVHIRTVVERQKYIVRMCKALMNYGAPTHRLEEYLRAAARVLEIRGQFMYLPGCMLISFDDVDMHTAEVKLVKENQGVDLGKFLDVFEIYKNVQWDKIDVTEAMEDLSRVTAAKDKYPIWVRVLVYGAASMAVGPFAFGARPTDWIISFPLGCMIGFFNLYLSPKSDNFSHVFEIIAAISTSFAARAFGSIRINGEYVFCFSAIAQSSIALILPGYTILCGSLELQSKNIVAGSVRMVYAIIFALWLGFGITVGTSLFGFMYADAVSVLTCPTPAYYDWWTGNAYLSHFPFVVCFTLCLIVINQGKWKQAPAMVLIAFAGYLATFFSGRHFAKNNVQIADGLGAFCIGSLANVYSRGAHGLAAAALLPAIFVMVPSGLAASGSLVAGLAQAQQITGNGTGTIAVVNNGTQGFVDAGSTVYSGTIFDVGYGMVQVAIGISAGLFLSALVWYPKGKKRSGLFSF